MAVCKFWIIVVGAFINTLGLGIHYSTVFLNKKILTQDIVLQCFQVIIALDKEDNWCEMNNNGCSKLKGLKRVAKGGLKAIVKI